MSSPSDADEKMTIEKDTSKRSREIYETPDNQSKEIIEKREKLGIASNIRESLKTLEPFLSPFIIEMRDTLHSKYNEQQPKLFKEEAAMYRRAWLLSHYGINFQDCRAIKAINTILKPNLGANLNLNLNENNNHDERILGAKNIVSFFQVSNCGEPEQNIVILWNGIMYDLLMQLQVGVSHRHKVVLEGEFNFSKIPSLKFPLIADSILKGLHPDNDLPICVIEFTAYPLGNFLHHKDVTKMGVMLSSLLIQRANQHFLWGTETIGRLRVFGILVGDVEMELCVAAIETDEAGKQDISEIISFGGAKALKTTIHKNSEAFNRIWYEEMIMSAKTSQEEALLSRMRSRNPSEETLNALLEFISLVLDQHRFLIDSDLPCDLENPGPRYESSLGTLAVSARPSGPSETPKVVKTGRFESLLETIQGSSLFKTKCQLYLFKFISNDRDHPGFKSFSEHQEDFDVFLEEPRIYFFKASTLILDLISATSLIHAEGFASLTYNKDSILFQGTHVFCSLLECVESSDFNAKALDSLNLIAFFQGHFTKIKTFIEENSKNEIDFSAEFEILEEVVDFLILNFEKDHVFCLEFCLKAFERMCLKLSCFNYGINASFSMALFTRNLLRSGIMSENSDAGSVAVSVDAESSEVAILEAGSFSSAYASRPAVDDAQLVITSSSSNTEFESIDVNQLPPIDVAAILREKLDSGRIPNSLEQYSPSIQPKRQHKN